MKRRTLILGSLGHALVWLSSAGCGEQRTAPSVDADPSEDSMPKIPSESPTVTPLRVDHSEWRPLLSAAAYGVLFEEDTERPFSSDLNGEKRSGTYVCAACFLPLFESEHKFDSGTGWPSFFRAIEGHLGTQRDFKLVLPRTEYHCARCGGHQGHVFKDGPRPTGLRYCNNGLALRFVEKGESLPELRTPTGASAS